MASAIVVLMLAGPAGETLKYDIQFAGTIIKVSGTLELHGATPVLRVKSIQSLR